jgi:hypothetical protein
MLVIAAGFALRFLMLSIIGEYRLNSGDPYNYVQLARSLLRGDGFVVNDLVYGPVRGMFPPLYPIALAAFGSVFGFSGWALLLMNGVTDAFTAAILKRHDIRAATIFFLWPSVVLGSFVAQKESLICLICVGLAELAVRHRHRTSAPSAALFGALSAALVLTQPALLFFPVALAAMFSAKAQGRLKAACIAALCGVAVMLPWWVRNWLIFRSFIPLTTTGGLSLAFVANDFRYLAPPAELIHLPEPARFSQFGRLAAGHIAREPFHYVVAISKQAARAVFVEKFALIRATSGSVSDWLIRSSEAIYLMLLLAAALGRDRFACRVVIAGLIALGPMLFLEFGERHRIFLLPFVILLACDGARRVSQWLKSQVLPSHFWPR